MSPPGIAQNSYCWDGSRDAELCPTQLCLFERCPHRGNARKIEIGMIAAEYAFGEAVGAMGITLSLLLISTVSAMLMAGQGVKSLVKTFVVRWLAKTNRDGIPMMRLGGCTAQCGAGAIVELDLSSFFQALFALNTFLLLEAFFLRVRQNGWNATRWLPNLGVSPTPLLYLALRVDPLVFLSSVRRSVCRCIDDCSWTGSLLVL